MTRPRHVPLPASDTNYVDVGQPWHATPTKIEPSAGLLAEGWQPNTPPAAQHANWKENNLAAMVRHLDSIQVQNWSEINQIDTTQTVAGHVPVIVWSETQKKHLFVHTDFATNLSKGRISSVGRKWSTAATPAGVANIRMLAENAGIVLGVSGTNTKIIKNAAGVWSDITGGMSGNITQHHGVIWSPSVGAFYTGGSYNAGANTWNGVITRWDATGAFVSLLTLAVPAGYTATPNPNGPDRFAASPTRTLVGASNTNGSTPAVWVTTNGAAWTLARITGPANLSALAYDSIRGTFQAWCGFDLYESADGITWALRHTVTVGGVNQIPDPNQFVISGSNYVAVQGTGTGIIYSTDSGLTWKELPYPFETASEDFSTSPNISGLTWVRDRFAAISYGNGGGFPHAAFTLRLE